MMSDFRNWNWAWSSVGTAINKHGGDLTPVQVAQLIEQGIEHGMQLAIAVFEFEALENTPPVFRGPQGIVNKLRHEFHGVPEFPWEIPTPDHQKPCGDPDCGCS